MKITIVLLDSDDGMMIGAIKGELSNAQKGLIREAFSDDIDEDDVDYDGNDCGITFIVVDLKTGVGGLTRLVELE